MADFDKRRSPYVPIDVLIAFGDFGTKLADKWGIEGLGCWMLFLAACKREPVQGTFTYTTDAEAWGKLGGCATGFGLDEFWTLTGRYKKTSRRRHGRITYVTCTRWDTWNTWRGPSQKPSKPAQNTAGKETGSGEKHPPKAVAEAEKNIRKAVEAIPGNVLPISVDVEVEVDRLIRFARDADAGSKQVVLGYANQLPLATVARIRQAAQEDGAKGIGWVVQALKGEIESREAA